MIWADMPDEWGAANLLGYLIMKIIKHARKLRKLEVRSAFHATP
jgi:hypothetical protein